MLGITAFATALVGAYSNVKIDGMENFLDYQSSLITENGEVTCTFEVFSRPQTVYLRTDQVC